LAVLIPAFAAALFGAKVVNASPGLPLVAADSAGADTTRPAQVPAVSPVDSTRQVSTPDTVTTHRLGVADTITTLPPVHVEGDRENPNARSSATSVHLDRGTIARFQPMTVADALLAAPGLYVSRTGPWASHISMRGLSGERVLVLVDGMRLQTGRGHGAQTSLVAIDRLESVDVLPGASGALYGSDALGGVVELNTHHNLLTERAATVMLVAHSATPGEENSATGRLRYTSPVFGAEFWAGAGGLDALVTPDGRVPNSSYHEYDISGRVTAKLWTSMLDFEHTQHETRDIQLPAFSDLAGSHAEFPLQGREANRLEWSMPAAGRRPEMRVLANNQRFRTNFVETTVDSQFFRGRYIATRNTRADDRITTTSSGVQPSLTIGVLKLNGEYRRETTQGPRYTDVSIVNTSGVQTSATREPGESMPTATRDVLAGAGYVGWTTWKHLRLESGLRYDWLHSSADSTPQSFTRELNVTDQRWSGEGGLSRAFGAVTPYGRIATGFRAPNLEERYFNDDIHGGLRLFGNPDLVAERTYSTEVGVRTGEMAGGRLIAARVSAYRSRVDELITLKYLGQLYLIPRFQYTNVHKARLDGIEMQVDGKLGWLRASANAAFPRGRDLETGVTIPDLGAARATLDLRMPVARVLPNGAFALRIRWTDASAQDDVNLARAASWYAATELACVAWGTRISLAVTTLTNTRYREPLSFIPAPGRTVLLSLRREMALPWPRVAHDPGMRP
jgi:hemoglobin/transferrin/lactoferrin receptor protein